MLILYSGRGWGSTRSLAITYLLVLKFTFKVNIQLFQESKETKVLFCCLEGKSNDRKKDSMVRKLLDTNILTGTFQNLQVN